MKKLFVILFCVVLIATVGILARAEDTDSVVVDSSSPTEEIVTESVFEGAETMPELTTEKIVEWVTANYEEITVILAVIAAALLIVQRLTMVIKSIVTCNNNAAVIAEDSKATTQAALDEVNVEAFGKYLSKLKEKTQFILITHKKKTMEFVDVLYGITMQESGVSKLVSVKLEEIKN